jgi:hypothetical protein
MKTIFSISFFIAASAAITSTVRSSELPVGDGHVTEVAFRGNVFACNKSFHGGGAQLTGNWFHGTTWNPDQKPRVQGKMMWPDATFSMTVQGEALAVAGNNLPVNQPTGMFPIQDDDPAYQYDTNPNAITPQALNLNIPLVPTKAAEPHCLPMGMIVVTTTGVALYNALDDAGRDAAAHEIQDLCDGHPQDRGQYHYHSGSPCLPNDNNALVGWAFDGYPILSKSDAAGHQLTNADLDACHGRSENISIEGRTYDYAYRLTAEYPYIIGCFTGMLDPPDQ